MAGGELGDEGAAGFEEVDNVVGAVGYVDVAVGSDGNPDGAEAAVVEDGGKGAGLGGACRGTLSAVIAGVAVRAPEGSNWVTDPAL